ncbi:MAG: DUF983 domain-containing protein [Hyphomonadaceae bacterium]
MIDLPFSEPLSPMRTGVRGRCPRCGEGKLFRSFLRLAPACEACGLDFGFADPADGPAFFVMSVTSFLAVGVAFVLQAALESPMWVILTASAAVIVGVSLALLTPIKGWLVNSQYFYKAGEGVLATPLAHVPCGCESCRKLAAQSRRRKRAR